MEFLWQAAAVVVIALLIALVARLRSLFSRSAKQGARLAALAKHPLQQQVCICCAHEDAGAAHFAAALLNPALEEVGLQVSILSGQGVKPGGEWPQALLDAAANSAVFVPVLSEHYHQDFWCMLGLDLALSAHPAAAARSTSGHCSLGPVVLPVLCGTRGTLHPAASTSRSNGSMVHVVQLWWSQRNVRKLVEARALSSECAEWVDDKQWATNMSQLVDNQAPEGRLECGVEQTQEQQWDLVQQVVAAVAQKMPGGVGVQDVPARLAELHKWLFLVPSGATRLELLRQAAKPRLERQVFISHTGQDEGAKIFAASILRPALEAAGLKTYMDFKELRTGDLWREELVNAAANSVVFVAVLSKKYYQRYWCMLELDLALNAHLQGGSGGGSGGSSSGGSGGGSEQGGQPVVLPVFYDTPEEVFGLQAAAAGADDRAVQRWWSDPEHLRKVVWKEEELGEEWLHRVDAERWAANLAAMKELIQHVRRSRHGDKDQEHALAQGVVEEAVQKMPKELKTEKGLVGVEEQRDWLLQRMKGRSGLWLWGIGGLGKTTMAKELFNHLSHGFTHSAMVELQKDDGAAHIAQHLAAVLKSMGSKGDASEGMAVLARRLGEWVKGKKMLYVLDNVWTASQLDHLLPVVWKEGSVVIVTSRFEQLTDSNAYCQVEERVFKTQLGLLENKDARCLFRQAVGPDPVPEALHMEEEAILKACGRLPLALRLAGGALYKKRTVQAWQDVHDALKQGVVGGDSEGRLKGVVTHSLLRDKHPALVSMFLDVATMLRGEPEAYALTLWRAWWNVHAGPCYEDLKRSSLVGVDEEGLLAMHDVPVALGRGFVLQETPGFEEHWGTRVWVEQGKHVGHTEARDAKQQKQRKVVCARLHKDHCIAKALDTGRLVDDLDLSNVQLLWLHKYLHGGEALAADRVVNDLDLSDVRLLWLDGLILPPCGKVLWLDITHADVGPWLHQHDLVILSAENPDASQLPAESLQMLHKLTVMHLRHSRQLASLPESFGQLSALQELHLSGCHQLAGLPKSFGQLSALQKLYLRRCYQLARLPESFGQLSALQKLDLSECEQLAGLPESFGQLLALQELDLSGCYQLAGLPESFGQLSALQKLYLRRCYQLARQPDLFWQLLALQELSWVCASFWTGCLSRLGSCRYGKNCTWGVTTSRSGCLSRLGSCWRCRNWT